MSKQAESPNLLLTITVATKASGPQISTRKGSVSNTPKRNGVLHAPVNFLVAEVGYKLFVVVWDVDRTFLVIDDYKIMVFVVNGASLKIFSDVKETENY